MIFYFLSLLRRLFGKKPNVSAAAPVSISPGGQNMKYAFLVGINKYVAFPEHNLRGCVNDVSAMWDALSLKFGFVPDNIRVLCDERATKHAILERLEWLVSSLKPGDIAVWHFSGHGSQIRDRLGDELDDCLDEIICPTDMDWDNPLTDDDIAEFFKRVPKGAKLFFIADCCHSGTIDRGGLNNPHEIKNRFLPAPADIAFRSLNRNLSFRRFGQKRIERDLNSNIHIIPQNHVLLSGCKDNQTSADAFIDGKYQGALTNALLRSLQQQPKNWFELHNLILNCLHGKFSQTPQLSGSDDLLKELIF